LIGRPLFFIRVDSLIVCAFESKPLTSIGDTDNWAKPHRTSLCTKMLVALRSPKGRTLKADQTVLDLIMKLKVDCPEI
jgi:hypothetical protein